MLFRSIASDLLTVFDKSFQEIEEIDKKLTICSEQWFLNAIFIYGYTIFESTLFKTYEIILKAFPEKIKFCDNNEYHKILSQKSLLTPLIETASSIFSKSFAYGELSTVLKAYNDTLEIGLNIKDSDFIEPMTKYKNMRNLLVHQGSYTEKINIKLLIEGLNNIKIFLEDIRDKIKCKYKEYTQLNLIRNSWKYIFQNCLPIDQIAVIKNDHIEYIDKERLDKHIGSLSSSEKFLAVLFFTNYNIDILNNTNIFYDLTMICSLDENSKNKIGYIVELFHSYPYLLH